MPLLNFVHMCQSYLSEVVWTENGQHAISFLVGNSVGIGIGGLIWRVGYKNFVHSLIIIIGNSKSTNNYFDINLDIFREYALIVAKSSQL